MSKKKKKTHTHTPPFLWKNSELPPFGENFVNSDSNYGNTVLCKLRITMNIKY